jgi:hypothetical protein
MRAFRYKQHFEQSREEIFAFITDLSTAPHWRNLVRHCEVEGGGPMRQGSIVLLTLDVGGKTMRVPSEVWLYEPPHRYGHHNITNGVKGVFEYYLEADGNGTTVSFSGDVRPYGWMWLFLPVILRTLSYRYRGQLAALKQAMEMKKV